MVMYLNYRFVVILYHYRTRQAGPIQNEYVGFTRSLPIVIVVHTQLGCLYFIR